MADKKASAGEHSKVTAVRKAAETLAGAVDAARAAGFAVDWPSRVDGLHSIAISETGTVGAEADDLTGTQVGTQTVET